MELGELCRVHRGQVTGNNAVWVARSGPIDLPPGVLFPSVTRARELFAAGSRLDTASSLRRVIDLPIDLGDLEAPDRRKVERFLTSARAAGADKGYIAEHRKVWWSVGLRACAYPRDVHGSPTSQVRAKLRSGAPHQHRTRPLPDRGAP